MRLYPDTRVRVERDRFDEEWSVLLANEPYNSWLNVPVTFVTEEAASRVADAIAFEAGRVSSEPAGKENQT